MQVPVSLLRGGGQSVSEPVKVGAQGEQRGAQVVGDGADELAALFLQVRLLVQGCVQVGAHGLQGGGDAGDLGDACAGQA